MENTLNILDFTCIAFASDATIVPRADVVDWKFGIEVFRATNVLYIPTYSLQARNGLVPLEAILYEDHLPWIQRMVKPDRAIIDLETVQRSPEQVCILGNLASRAFGHWTEELIKVMILEETGFKGKYVITPSHPPFADESLEAMGVMGDRLLRPADPVVYAVSWYTTPVSHFTALRHRDVFFRFREHLHAAAKAQSGADDRVWLDRGATAAGRQVINGEEVAKCLKRHGFQSIDIGSRPFRHQVAIARDAQVICGPHGSAFVHCQFMHNRKDVIELFSPHFINPSVIQLCQALEHRYNQIVPTHATEGWPYPHGRDLMVDIDHLELVLSSLPPWPSRWGPRTKD